MAGTDAQRWSVPRVDFSPLCPGDARLDVPSERPLLFAVALQELELRTLEAHSAAVHLRSNRVIQSPKNNQSPQSTESGIEA
jgi:hypothetical protein